MNYYIDVFSPETYEAFTKSNMTVSGVSKRFKKFAQSIKPGDKFICYLTKISRWCGILEVLSECFEDDSPIFYSEQDPYIIRFKVKPLIWLPLDKSIPIYDDTIWNNLSFTKNSDKNSATWTIKFRSSLSKLSKSDGVILEKILKKQRKSGNIYKLTEDDKKKLKTYKIIISDAEVDVSVPEEDTEPVINNENKHIKESTRIQYLLAQLGERMGFSIWLPKNNRTELHKLWKPIREDSLLNVLPLNYDDVTLKTIEQIDVLWIKKKTIIRAFEVEHTTSIYSGILRIVNSVCQVRKF